MAKVDPFQFASKNKVEMFVVKGLLTISI